MIILLYYFSVFVVGKTNPCHCAPIKTDQSMNNINQFKTSEKAIVEFLDYQIPDTQLVGMPTRNFIIFLTYRYILVKIMRKN